MKKSKVHSGLSLLDCARQSVSQSVTSNKTICKNKFEGVAIGHGWRMEVGGGRGTGQEVKH